MGPNLGSLVIKLGFIPSQLGTNKHDGTTAPRRHVGESSQYEPTVKSLPSPVPVTDSPSDYETKRDTNRQSCLSDRTRLDIVLKL